MFDTVLVANRGEIAVRVIRTLRRLGVCAVAVFSDADADARHVREADTAVRIGPPAAADSYLSIERLLDAAARTGAQAVHPGYGFLSENAAFARACAEAGLSFVGPPAEAIALMGDKIRAKETVAAAGVPVVPGSSGTGLTDAELADAARAVGLPVLLKPSAGGGGKGMRLVRDAALLPDEIAAARREARGAFGDDTLLVERWIDRPRHIEIQVLADRHGHVVHLGERECSLQRRHQKIIEEAPSPLLGPATRAAMGEAAVRAARSCGYTGAGTVEFIVPGDDPSAYCFMEMNTRLQVEHPVTELITGLDLVEWQLRVAAGEPLPAGAADQAAGGGPGGDRVPAAGRTGDGGSAPWPEADGRSGGITPRGHAVEARICAETPRAAGDRVDFLPSAGTVLALTEPSGEGVRVDSGLIPGARVGTVYDPMLTKVIAHGPDRATALRRLRAALAATTVLGLDTNVGFLRRLAAHPDVVAGDLDTGLVDRAAAVLVPTGIPDEVYAAVALLRQAALGPADHAGLAAYHRPPTDTAAPGRPGTPPAGVGPAQTPAAAGGTARAGGPTPPPGGPTFCGTAAGPGGDRADGWVDPFAVPSGWRLAGEAAWTLHHLRVPGHDPVTVRVRGFAADAEVRVDRRPADGAGSAEGPRHANRPTNATHRTPGPAAATAPAPPADATAPAPPADATAPAVPADAAAVAVDRPAALPGGTVPGAPPDGGPPVVRARLTRAPAGPEAARPEAAGAERVLLDWDGVTHVFTYAGDGADHWLARSGDAWRVTEHDPVAAALGGGAAAVHAGALTAPMPGTVTVVKAAVGDTVQAGQSLLVVEAMKMEHVISAPHDGTVTELDVAPGSTVAMDQLLAVVAPHQESHEAHAELAAPPEEAAR